MKKVLVVGAGAQGGPCASILARDKDVSQIVLGDIDLDLANKVKEKTKSDKVTALLGTASSMEQRQEYIYEMQELMAEDLPYAFLVRPEFISAYRTDKFEGWISQIGGPVSWFNPWSIMKVHLK